MSDVTKLQTNLPNLILHVDICITCSKPAGGEIDSAKHIQESALLEILDPNTKTAREIAEYIIDTLKKQNKKLASTMEGAGDEHSHYYYSCKISKFNGHTTKNTFLGRAEKETQSILEQFVIVLKEWGVEISK